MSENVTLGDGVLCGIEQDADNLKHRIIIPHQTHSCNVGIIEKEGMMPPLEDTDALICFRVNERIGVRTADCVPVLLFAPDIKAIAAVHAGWKGTLEGILDNVIGILVDKGADTGLMKAAFGPSICGKCYEVSEELTRAFIDKGFDEAIVGHRHISLEKVNTLRLLNAGMRFDNISPGRYCTKETPWLPSWRRNPSSKRLVTWIEMIDSVG